MSTQDPFAKYGGSAVAEPEQDDPFAKYGGSAVIAPVKAPTPTPFVRTTKVSSDRAAFQQKFERAQNVHTTQRPPDPDRSAVTPSLEDAMEPITQKAFGFSVTNIAEKLLPETEPRPLRDDTAVAVAEAGGVDLPLYDMARRGAKMAAGIVDFMQSPIGLAAALAGVAGRTAGQVAGSLLGIQFGIQGTNDVIDGLEDMRKRGVTPENAEKFLNGLAMVEGVALGGVALGTKRKKVKAADVAKANELAATEVADRVAPLAQPRQAEPITPKIASERAVPVQENVATVTPDAPVAVLSEPAEISLRPSSTVPEFHKALGVLRTHKAKGKLGDAAETLTADDLFSYLDEMQAVSEGHYPAAIEMITEAQDTLMTSGDKVATAKLAEQARKEMRGEYGRRLAASEAAKHGIELPKEEPAPDTAVSEVRQMLDEQKELDAVATERDRIIRDASDNEMRVWADDTDELIGAREAEKNAMTMESNVAGKEIEEATVARGNAIRSLGAKENSPLAHFKESPKVLSEAIRKGDGVLYDRIRKAFRESYETAHGGKADDFLASASERQKQDLLGETAEPVDADVSFDFGENALKSIGEFETRQKQAIKDLMRGAASGETAGAGLPIEIAGRLAAIGAAKIAKGSIRFAQWSAEMLRDLGDEVAEQVRPYLRDIWKDSLNRTAELKKLDADDYFNFRRANISDGEKQALKAQTIATVLETGRVPKERESWATIREQARKLGGPELVAQLAEARGQQPELRGVRLAARQRINTLNREITELSEKAALARGEEGLAIERVILEKENDLRGLHDIWMRMRSEDGRNLAMHRMMSDSTWDASYWLARAKRAKGIPAGAELPTKVQRDIGDILTNGQKAADKVGGARKEIARKLGIPENDVPNLPELTGGRPETLYGTQEATIGKRGDAPKGEDGVVPGEQLDLNPARAVPELPPGPPVSTKGIQQDIANYRQGMEELKQHKIRLARKMRELDRSGWMETLIALRNVGLLTGLKTHMRNIGGNASFQILEELSRLPAATVDLVMSLKTGQRTMQGASPKALLAALNEARTKGIADAREVFRTGATVDELGKVELHRELNSGIPWLDGYARFITRTMAAEDRVFKSFAFRRSLEEQAALTAKNGGPSIIETIRNPPDAMIQQAIYDAQVATFNNPNVFAQGVKAMQGRMRSEGTPGKMAAAAIDIAVPFKNTPANIIARVFDYAGGGFAKAGFHAIRAMVDGTMTPAMQRAISQGVGRGMTGAALITLGYMLGKKGLATGVQPTDPGAQNVAQAAGRLPGSVQVAGRWHQVAPFSPAGNLITIGATIARESSKPLRDESRRPGNIAAIAARTALEQPMLKGLSDTVEALRNPAATGERVTSTTIGSFIPTLLADSAALFDPYMRDARTDGFLESLYKGFQLRTPGWRNVLPQRFDVLGDPVRNTPGTFVNPMISAPAKELSDPAIQRLITTETAIGFPRRDPGESKESFSLRSQIVGREIKRRVGQIEFDAASDMDQRRTQVKRAVDASRDQFADFFRAMRALPEAERIERLRARLAQ